MPERQYDLAASQGLRGFKVEQSTPEGHKTLSPSNAVSRGLCGLREWKA